MIKNNIKQSGVKVNKYLILTLIFVLVIFFAIQISGYNKPAAKKASPNSQVADFDSGLDIGFPQGNKENLNNVPKAEIDSLFSSLK